MDLLRSDPYPKEYLYTTIVSRKYNTNDPLFEIIYETIKFMYKPSKCLQTNYYYRLYNKKVPVHCKIIKKIITEMEYKE